MTTLISHFVMLNGDIKVPTEIFSRGLIERLSVMPVKLDHEGIREQLALIGDDWHLRAEHTDPRKVKNTKKILETDTKTHTWFFMRGDQQIGFCCAVKGGFDKSLVEKFGLSAADTSEIYKVGLRREFTNNGLGRVFLPVIQSALFYGQVEMPEQGIKAIKPSTAIYLNTRDSNHVDSRGFYRSLGYKMVGQEQIIEASSPDELGFRFVPAEEQNNGHTAVSRPQMHRPLSPNMQAPAPRRAAS